MLQNAYFLAKIGADTAENEQQFAEILPKTGNYPTGSCQFLATAPDLAGQAAPEDAPVVEQRELLLADLASLVFCPASRHKAL